jgi:hypothetical protein
MSVFVVCLRRESKAPAPVLMSSTGTGIDRFCVVAFVGLVVVRVYGVVPLLLALGGHCAEGVERVVDVSSLGGWMDMAWRPKSPVDVLSESRSRGLFPFQPDLEDCMLFSRASLQVEWPQTTRWRAW